MRTYLRKEVCAIASLLDVPIHEIAKASGYSRDMFSKIINGVVHMPPDFSSILRDAFRKLEESNRIDIASYRRKIKGLGAFASEILADKAEATGEEGKGV